MRRTVHLLSLALLVAAGAARAESLYNENTYRPLTSDVKAYRVGDTLTVQVIENSSASSSTDTTTQRNNGINAGINILNHGPPQGGTLTAGGTFSGGGTTQRANKVLAVLTVTVREVLPSGDLKVGGEQLLTINEESHNVKVEGRVRPQDVSTDNVVLSTRLADARITYAGDGDVSDRAHRAWWRKLVDWLGF